MKTRIITIHGIPNFGSVFQSYGLCKYLKDNGFDDTRIIDYNPECFRKCGLRALLGRVLNFKSYVTRTKKFRSFIEKNLSLTEKSYNTIEELHQEDFGADVYIAGGDQLWNVYHPGGNDTAYRLTCFKGKKISYATSMGQKDFPQQELTKLSEDIKDFSHISVREASSVQLLESKGLKATNVVDPVFLLPVEEYEKFLVPVNQPDYLLVYLVTPSKLLEDTIAFLKEKYNLKVILCSGFQKKCTCDEHLKDLGPDEILSYIKNAKIVLSSSFHATAFSIMFQKQFYTILPDEHTNERIEDLLQKRGLSQRIVKNDTKFDVDFDKEINYSSVEDYSNFIEASKEYLAKALSE